MLTDEVFIGVMDLILVLMQHFGLGTRALDISESPLAALYFACSPMKKFCQNREEEMSNWGEIGDQLPN